MQRRKRAIKQIIQRERAWHLIDRSAQNVERLCMRGGNLGRPFRFSWSIVRVLKALMFRHGRAGSCVITSGLIAWIASIEAAMPADSVLLLYQGNRTGMLPA